MRCSYVPCNMDEWEEESSGPSHLDHPRAVYPECTSYLRYCNKRIQENMKYKKETRLIRDQTECDMSSGSCYLRNSRLQNLAGKYKFLAVIHCLQTKLPKCPSIFT